MPTLTISAIEMISDLSQALCHEAIRIFGDMLTTVEEREKLEVLIGSAIEEKWNKSSSPIFDKLKSTHS
jgi:hypothetical protein